MVFLNISTSMLNNQKFSVIVRYNSKDSTIYKFYGTGRCSDSVRLKVGYSDLSIELTEFGLSQSMWIPRSYRTATVDIYVNSYYSSLDSSYRNNLSVYQYDHEEFRWE